MTTCTETWPEALLFTTIIGRLERWASRDFSFAVHAWQHVITTICDQTGRCGGSICPGPPKHAWLIVDFSTQRCHSSQTPSFRLLLRQKQQRSRLAKTFRHLFCFFCFLFFFLWEKKKHRRRSYVRPSLRPKGVAALDLFQTCVSTAQTLLSSALGFTAKSRFECHCLQGVLLKYTIQFINIYIKYIHCSRFSDSDNWFKKKA